MAEEKLSGYLFRQKTRMPRFYVKTAHFSTVGTSISTIDDLINIIVVASRSLEQSFIVMAKISLQQSQDFKCFKCVIDGPDMTL